MTDRTQQILAQWQDRTNEITLSSGLPVIVRPIDVLSLMDDDGNVPNPLLPLIMRFTNGGGGANEKQVTDTISQQVKDDPNWLKNLVGRINQMLIRVVVAPPLIEAGHENGISLDNFTLNEKMEIFTHLMGDGTQVSNFRQQPGADVERVPAGQTVSGPAKRPAKRN